MKTFKSIPDLEQVRNAPLYATIKSLFLSIVADCPDYRPEDDGWLVLIESTDAARVLDDLDMPYRLSEMPFEGVTMIDGCFLAVWLPNNQFGLDFLIPDASWLPGDVRRQPFLDQVEELMSSAAAGKPKGTVKKSVRKAPSKKAAVKKRATTRKKSSTRTGKTSSAQS